MHENTEAMRVVLALFGIKYIYDVMKNVFI